MHTMKIIAPGMLFLLACLLSGSGPAVAATAKPVEPLLQETTALEHWQDAVQQAEAAGNRSATAAALVNLARTQNGLGQYHAAGNSLQRALGLLDAGSQPELVATALAGLGHARMQTGSYPEAAASLAGGLALAERLSPRTHAMLLGSRGNLALLQEDSSAALEDYDRASELLSGSGEQLLQARILANSVRAAIPSGDIATRYATALRAIEALADSSDKATLYINLGQSASRLTGGNDANWPLRANSAFTSAEQTASAIGDQRALSYALGYRGELYASRDRNAEALALFGRAMHAAQASGTPQALYQWQWQSGRLLHHQGDSDAAIDAYRSAIVTLRSVRNDAGPVQGGSQAVLRETAAPLYFELADLLLQRARSRTDVTAANSDLLEARDHIESLKAAELQDYFRDDCVTELQSRTVRLEQVGGRTAILYPIMLEDRLELLLTLPDGLRQVTIGIPRERIIAAVRDFRQLLEKRITRQYLRSGSQLYDWLITPVEAVLQQQQVNTLVVVPDGALRTIPLGALYDSTGKQYLIEKYAIAYTPGLFLTDARALPRDDVKLLLNGLTVSVDNFPALPNVASELASIQAIHEDSTILQDSSFTVSNVEDALQKTPYSVVHIASHGQFSSDRDETFLLAYNERLSIDRLEDLMGLGQYRTQPVELLALSACQTAAGDDRAALGLAGIAVKAGARSALASLWFVSDAATSELIAEFYEQLNNPGVSKAQALQHAQVKLLRDQRYRHAGYWAPYLLIGNWL